MLNGRRTRHIVVALIALVAFAGAVLRIRSRPALPTITLGGVTRAEACLACHATTTGVGSAHAALGCSPCHLGDPQARDREGAHRGLELLAGDFASVDRSCAQGECHAAEAARVRSSTMARAPGILAVDRFAFGESSTPDGNDLDTLGAIDPNTPARSPAELHARELCANCHLGQRKEHPGDEGEAARGGGCTACHLAPPAPAEAGRTGPLHPEISARVPERRCTGCHSRSGRISLSYHGIVELEPGDPRVSGTLADGRPIAKIDADVHARAGLGCIDCHTERELMGDGRLHRHAEDALDVGCEDCHLARKNAPPVDADRLSVAERLRAYWVRRGLAPPSSGPPLLTRAGTPLTRTNAQTRSLFIAETGTERNIPFARDREYHALKGHERLSCSACHAQWAPRCGSCHTRFEPNSQAIDHLSGKPVSGSFIERAGDNGFGPSLLALGARGKIEPFVEGMKLTIEGTSQGTVTRNLYAPLEPHTTGRARACRSCHAPDKPDDVYPSTGETTRTKARLLDANERAKVLRVGQCLFCHEKYEDPVYRDFEQSLRRLLASPAARTARDPLRRCKGKIEPARARSDETQRAHSAP